MDSVREESVSPEAILFLGAAGKAKLEGDKATGRTFGRRHDWVCIFLHPSCNGGTNFPGLRTGRGARLRGRNSMEDFEECSSFKGWG